MIRIVGDSQDAARVQVRGACVGSVAVLIFGQRFTEAWPRADVHPPHAHRDGADRDALVLCGSLHDRVVNADLGQLGVHLFEHSLLSGRAPSLTDAVDAFVRGALEPLQRFEELLGRKDEHAAVPSERSRVEILLCGLGIRLLDKALGDVSSLEPGDGSAALHIAVGGGGMRGHDGKGHKARRILFHQLKAQDDFSPELVLRFDDVVRGQHGEHSVGVLFGEHRGREADGVDRVAPHRLAENLLIGETRQHLVNERAMRLTRTQQPAVGLYDTLEAVDGQAQQ